MTKSKSQSTTKKLSRGNGSAKVTAKSESLSAPQEDWRVTALDEVRRLIQAADPDIVEERKWKKPTNPAGVPVWSHAGIVCTGETYKQVVKLTFARGASLEDPHGLFNSSLDGNTRRAIDVREGERLDPKAFKTLIKAAVERNLRSQGANPRQAPKKNTKANGVAKSAATKPVELLSGGNPQIAKGDGDAPVQAYIDAMPGWKHEVGRRLDTLIVRTVPRVRKAVKWNSPFYGVEGQGWFLNFHCFNKFVRVAFFRGQSLRPVPPGASKHEEVRYLDVYEDAAFDEKRFTAWVKQAAKSPGWMS